MKLAVTDGGPGSIHQLRLRLLAFFDTRARELPWRETHDPYAIWVSEIMLQQTRVDTVVPYYRRWMERFPDVESLADADRDEVLKEWEGLGYYSRARNLHRAAALVRERFGGELPGDVEGLRELPGVGEYTSGAVASIAFGRAVPAVDGNVRRVLSRLFDLEAPGAAKLRHRAAELVDPERPGDFNQALMELGATVCTPADPVCEECPVAEECLALERGTVRERPSPRKRARVREAAFAVAVVADAHGRLLLERRPEEVLLGGMWAFPEAEVAAGRDDSGAGTTVETAARGLVLGLPYALAVNGASAAWTRLDPVRHTFSHIRARYLPCLLQMGRAADAPPDPDLRWASSADLAELALPVAQRKIWNAAGAHLASI